MFQFHFSKIIFLKKTHKRQPQTAALKQGQKTKRNRETWQQPLCVHLKQTAFKPLKFGCLLLSGDLMWNGGSGRPVKLTWSRNLSLLSWALVEIHLKLNCG